MVILYRFAQNKFSAMSRINSNLVRYPPFWIRSRIAVPVGAFESKSRLMTASSCSRLSKVEKSRSGKQFDGKTILPCEFSSKGST